jgi:AraC-like DNA-binding protein
VGQPYEQRASPPSEADIELHLTDSSLTVDAVAARHGVTPRYVHKLFADDTITCAKFVLDRRLERARRLLQDQRAAAPPISSIAYDVGFGDLSYFNRTFRRAFHMTPSDARRMPSAERDEVVPPEPNGPVDVW